jgi:hypothetical protein
VVVQRLDSGGEDLVSDLAAVERRTEVPIVLTPTLDDAAAAPARL